MVRRFAVMAAWLLMSAAPVLAADVTGTWVVSGPVTPVCSLTQAGTMITGACKGPNAQGTVLGTNDGQTVKWTYSWTTLGDNSPGKFDFSGTLDGDTITGTVTAELDSGAFTATRQHQPLAVSAMPPVINSLPPKGVWTTVANGAALNPQSGMVCPLTNGDFIRSSVTMFDQFGYDVSCNYKGPSGDVTFYLTREAPGQLPKTLEIAKAALLKLTPDAVLRADVLPTPAGLSWIGASYDEKGATRRSDILYAQISGWIYEIRATYPAENMAKVTAAVADLTGSIRASAGAHLAACDAAPVPVRDGQRIRDLDLLLKLSITGGSTAKHVHDAGDAVWCAEGGLSAGPTAYDTWRNVAPGGVPADRISAINGSLDILTVPDKAVTDTPQVFDVVVENADSLQLAAMYAGRPGARDIAELTLAKAFGVYADVNKATGAITVHKPF